MCNLPFKKVCIEDLDVFGTKFFVKKLSTSVIHKRPIGHH